MKSLKAHFTECIGTAVLVSPTGFAPCRLPYHNAGRNMPASRTDVPPKYRKNRLYPQKPSFGILLATSANCCGIVDRH